MVSNRILQALCWLTLVVGSSSLSRADDEPIFFRGINLNGSEVTIDGHPWEGGDCKSYLCNDRAFSNQSVPLVPATDPQRAEMLRSSRWGGNRVELLDIPKGNYTLFLYVWEDNNPETYTVTVNGQQVLANYNSVKMGQWDSLGPWYVAHRNEKMVIASSGGAENLSGVELWRGR